MNSIKITFLILLASYSLSCTRSKDPIAHFKMTMPTKTQLLAAQGQFVNTQQFNSNNPTSLGDINCFAIVVAADYLNDSSCKILDSSGVAVGTKPFGRLEGFFMLGQEVTLPAIPSEPGTEGEISIYGSKSTTGICEPAGAINDTNYTRPVFLGYSKVLMNPSDTPVNVRINISYTNGAATNQFVGDCQGPHGPGNHNDPGNTTGNLVSYPTPNDGNPLYMFEADVQTLAPIINGENPVSYSISPSVTPHGLIFDTNTGSINGTVNSSFASAQTYTVTATYANNTTTSTSFDLEFPKRFRVNKLNTGADDVIDGICYNTAEGGCTLLAALQEANDSGNTVNTHILLDDLGTPALFPFGVPFVFSNPNAIELHIVGHLDANGDPNSVMDAAANAILQVNGSSSLHLVNLKFMDAMESSVGGAALFFSSTGDLVMDHVYMYGNYTNASSGGGAVKVAGASTVKILKSTFELNSANNGRGGALYITGSGILIDIIDSDFESNTVAASGFDGGAIYITDTAANLLIRGTSFNYNSIANAAWGGGALYFGGANLTIENSAFYNNTATNSSFGGALYLNIGNALSDWYFTNVSFDSNGASAGGAVYFSGTSTYYNVFLNSAFTVNTGSSAGAALYGSGGANVKLGSSYFDGNSGASICSSLNSNQSLKYNYGSSSDASCMPSGGSFDNFAFGVGTLYGSPLALGDFNIKAGTNLLDGAPSSYCTYDDIQGFVRPAASCRVGPYDPGATAP